MYSVHQLQAFVATVNTGSFKQAALKLDKRASTVAELVASLEDECDLKLFERQTRKLVLTDVGKSLLISARATLSEAEHFRSAVLNANQAHPTQLVVAIDSLIMHVGISSCYEEILEEFPSIDLKVLIGDTLQVVDWVTKGKAEIGLISSALQNYQQLTQFNVFNFELATVAPPAWFNSGAVVSEADIRGRVQLNYLHLQELELAERYNISHRVTYVNNTQEILNMVSAGLGWANICRESAKLWLDAGLVNEFSIEGENPIHWFAEVIHLNDNEPSIAADLLIEKFHGLGTN